MKNNKHAKFVKSIRLSSDEPNPPKKMRGEQNTETYRGVRQEEYDLEKELERRFDELFGSTEGDD